MLVNNFNAYKYELSTTSKNITSGHGLRSVAQSCICTVHTILTLIVDSCTMYLMHRYVGV